MKTIEELNKLTKEELVLKLWELYQEENLIKQLKLLRLKNEAFTICLFEDRNDSFYFGRLDLVLKGLVGCIDIVCEKSGTPVSDVLNELIKKLGEKK